MRGDLDMTSGKLAAMSGHAFLDAYVDAHDRDPELCREYRGENHGTKVCLKARNLTHLERLYEEAKQAGLPCALVINSGHIHPPHFTGEPIAVALGIGPCRRDQINHITRRLSLVK